MAKRLGLIGLIAAIAAVSAAFSPGSAAEFSWQLTPTGSTARLRGATVVAVHAWQVPPPLVTPADLAPTSRLDFVALATDASRAAEQFVQRFVDVSWTT